MKKYRVFKSTVTWADVIFVFDLELKFKDIILNTKTSYLKKENYIGEFDFDDKFLKLFNKNFIKEKEYYYLYHYENDNITFFKNEERI